MSGEIATQHTPMDLLVRAQQSGATIEQMQQLLDLQDRWEAREAKKSFNMAMSFFREGCPTINRGRQGHNSRYAGLAETLEIVKKYLAKNGLSHHWQTSQDGSFITVTCTVTHRDGHSESTSLSAAPDTSGGKNSIQAVGSTVAYLERYTLYAILGLASREMDDDANSASSPIEYVSEEQLASIDALINETGTDISKFCTYMKADHLYHIRAKDYDMAIKALESKRTKR